MSRWENVRKKTCCRAPVHKTSEITTKKKTIQQIERRPNQFKIKKKFPIDKFCTQIILFQRCTTTRRKIRTSVTRLSLSLVENTSPEESCEGLSLRFNETPSCSSLRALHNEMSRWKNVLKKTCCRVPVHKTYETTRKGKRYTAKLNWTAAKTVNILNRTNQNKKFSINQFCNHIFLFNRYTTTRRKIRTSATSLSSSLVENTSLEESRWWNFRREKSKKERENVRTTLRNQ